MSSSSLFLRAPSPLSRRCLPLLGLFLAVAGPAAAQNPLTAYAVFGGQSVTLSGPGKVNTGLIGSNGDVALGPSLECRGAEGGGQLRYVSTGGSTITGPVTFNGDVALGVATKVRGPISSGRNISVVAQSVLNGDITAAGDVTIGLSAAINGNVHAGGSFYEGAFDKMTGDVVANNGASIGGLVNGTVTTMQIEVPFGGALNGKAIQKKKAVTPARFSPVAVPPADDFKAGTEDNDGAGDADDPLKPGRYGALGVGQGRKVYLTSGDYYFTSITLASSASVHLVNVTPAKGLHVFVTGDIRPGTFVSAFVNGKPYAEANPALAGKVLWETLGDFDGTANGQGDYEWFGAVFAPKGAVNFGNNVKLTGSAVGATDVTAGAFFTQTFVPSGRFVAPPPVPTLAPATPAAPTPPAPTAPPLPTPPLPTPHSPAPAARTPAV
jgi:cytoskeletal protein CcmA (bactofilin family)